MSDNILPADAEQITDEFLRGLNEDKDETVYCHMDKPAKAKNEIKQRMQKNHKNNQKRIQKKMVMNYNLIYMIQRKIIQIIIQQYLNI